METVELTLSLEEATALLLAVDTRIITLKIEIGKDEKEYKKKDLKKFEDIQIKIKQKLKEEIVKRRNKENVFTI